MASSASGGAVTIYSPYGTDVSVEAPPPEETIDFEELMDEAGAGLGRRQKAPGQW